MRNYRYADTDWMKNVFLIRFSKTHLDRAKAERRANACIREGFTIASIKKDTYTCSLNFIGDIVFTLNHVHYNQTNSSSSWMVKLCTFASENNMLVLSANYITF